MPRKKPSCQRLHKLIRLSSNILSNSIVNIDNIEKLNTFKNNFTEIINKSNLGILGFPFHLFNEIVDDIGKNKNLNYFNVQLVMVFNRFSLTLSYFFREEWNIYHQFLLSKLGQECQKLQILDLEGCSAIPSESLKLLVYQLQNLKHLNLINTQCNNDVVNYIWNTSKNLESLYLPNYSTITDQALKDLHLDLPLCQNLIHLICCSPNISTQGVINILKHFPKMQMLKCLQIKEALKLIFAEKISFQLPPLQNIYRPLLFRYDNIYEWNDILSNCKNLVELSISGGKHFINSDDIKLLNNLIHLKQLQYFEETLIDNINKRQFMQIIQICGRNLEVVLFFGWNQVFDITEFGCSCPNLRLLHVWGGRLVYTKYQDLSLKFYTKLNALHIISPCIRWATQQEVLAALTFLLRQCINIKILQLMDVSIVDDNIITSILKDNPMLDLEDLDFYNIPHITVYSIYKFLNQLNNNLQLLKIRECLNITHEEYARILNYAESKQFDLMIIYR